MQSRAAVVTAFGEPMELAEIDVDDPQPGEVRVRVTASGICGSDIKAWAGRNPLYPSAPVVLGHECVGVIDAVGSDVDTAAEGEPVLVSMNRWCGRCIRCAAGAAHLCADPVRQKAIRGLLADGTTRLSRDGETLTPFIGIGSFAEHIVVGESMVVPLGPGEISTSMALLSCGVVTGFGAVRNIARVRPGETVLVTGCGGVGLNVVQAAVLAGAAVVIAADVVPGKLEMARSLGATHALDAGDDLAARVREIESTGVDHAFDVTGASAVLPQAMAATRPGGTTVLVGSPAIPAVELPPGLFMAGRRLLGCVGGDASPGADLPLLVRMARSGRLALDPLVSERVGIEDINAAVARVRAGESARSLVVSTTMFPRQGEAAHNRDGVGSSTEIGSEVTNCELLRECLSGTLCFVQ